MMYYDILLSRYIIYNIINNYGVNIKMDLFYLYLTMYLNFE